MGSKRTNLDSRNICVLRDVFVLVEGVLGKLSLLLLDGKLDEEEHHRLQSGDGNISRSLVGDVFVQEVQGGGSLTNADEFMGALENILRLLMRRRRLYKSL